MLSKPEEGSLKGLVPRDRFVERGTSAVVSGFQASHFSFDTGLVSNLLYRCFEFGTGQRKEEKREKNKFRIKPINGQTLIFDFL